MLKPIGIFVLLMVSFTFPQDLGIGLGVHNFGYQTEPDFEDGGNEVALYSPIYLVYYDQRLTEQIGMSFSISYLNFEREYLLENIFSLEEKFDVVPLGVSAWSSVDYKGFTIKPKIGVSYFWGKYQYKYKPLLMMASLEKEDAEEIIQNWEYTSSNLGYNLGVEVSTPVSNTLEIGIETKFQWINFTSFSSDVKCENSLIQNRLVQNEDFYFSSCNLSSSEELYEKATINLSGFEIILKVDFDFMEAFKN